MALNEIKACRVCGTPNLDPIINLGRHSLTGTFPKTPRQAVRIAPLELVKCRESAADCCGLVQLRQSVDLREMYGHDYGYRSSLNKSMVAHLQRKTQKIADLVKLKRGDLIVDIGSPQMPCTSLRVIAILTLAEPL